MMHLFITGPRGAGKTYVANRCAAAWPGQVLGFRSRKKEADPATGQAQVVLTDLAAPETEHVVANISEADKTVFLQVFNTAGAAALARVAPGYAGLVLMDEIGFLESEAAVFQAEILRVLGLGVPVLAVLRQQSTPFLNTLLARKDAQLVTVTRQTRAAALQKALAWVERQAPAGPALPG